MIDLGCGEGWLLCVLVVYGIDGLGVDVVLVLVDIVCVVGGGCFVIMDYVVVVVGLFDECVDVVVCNFLLLGEVFVDCLLVVIFLLLMLGGVLLI